MIWQPLINSRWDILGACLVGKLYLTCPGMLNLACRSDKYMSIMSISCIIAAKEVVLHMRSKNGNKPCHFASNVCILGFLPFSMDMLDKIRFAHLNALSLTSEKTYSNIFSLISRGKYDVLVISKNHTTYAFESKLSKMYSYVEVIYNQSEDSKA